MEIMKRKDSGKIRNTKRVFPTTTPIPMITIGILGQIMVPTMTLDLHRSRDQLESQPIVMDSISMRTTRRKHTQIMKILINNKVVPPIFVLKGIKGEPLKFHQ